MVAVVEMSTTPPLPRPLAPYELTLAVDGPQRLPPEQASSKRASKVAALELQVVELKETLQADATLMQDIRSRSEEQSKKLDAVAELLEALRCGTDAAPVRASATAALTVGGEGGAAGAAAG